MKFSIAALLCGVILLAAPIAGYAYQLQVMQEMLADVMKTNGSMTLPAQPTAWYLMSCLGGLLLFIVGYLSERRIAH
jgi:glucan phosphoethanolaminetransferase (alkaline phosphatase superfamily)